MGTKKKRGENNHTDNVTSLKIKILYECITHIPPSSPKAVVTSAAMTMPIQSPAALRDTDMPGVAGRH